MRRWLTRWKWCPTGMSTWTCVRLRVALTARARGTQPCECPELGSSWTILRHAGQALEFYAKGILRYAKWLQKNRPGPIFDLWMFQRHLRNLAQHVSGFLVRAVQAMTDVVNTKRDLNAPLMRVALAAAAVSPFKLVEDAEWTAHVEQMREFYAQCGTGFQTPEPPVDYLCPNDREEGTKIALAYMEALEFDALKRAAVRDGGRMLSPGLRSPGPRLSDRYGLTKPAKVESGGEDIEATFDTAAIRSLASAIVGQEFERWRLCPKPKLGSPTQDAALEAAFAKADMMSYVRLTGHAFPRLACLWRRLLAMPLSTAYLEGAFSVVKIVDDERRTRLSSDVGMLGHQPAMEG